MQGLTDINVWHHVSIDEHKVWTDQGLGIYIPQHIAERTVQVRGDDVDYIRRGGAAPFWFTVGGKRKTWKCHLTICSKRRLFNNGTNSQKRSDNNGVLTASAPWSYWTSNSRRQRFPVLLLMSGTLGCSQSSPHCQEVVEPGPHKHNSVSY